MSGQRRRGVPQRWQGRAWIGPGWAVFEGRSGDNRPHAHHALQLVLGVEGPVTVQVGPVTITAPALLIAADVPHALHPGRTRLLFVERESAAGRQISAAFPQDVQSFDALTADALRAAWPLVRDVAELQPLLRVLCGNVAGMTTSMDPGSLARLQRVIGSLPARVATPLALATLANEAALSPSRFAHRFKSITGLAVRPYLRWLRLAHALAFAAGGDSLTQAAYRAGFSDAAHLTRTMQRHFGVAPRDIVDSLRDD